MHVCVCVCVCVCVQACLRGIPRAALLSPARSTNTWHSAWHGCGHALATHQRFLESVCVFGVPILQGNVYSTEDILQPFASKSIRPLKRGNAAKGEGRCIISIKSAFLGDFRGKYHQEFAKTLWCQSSMLGTRDLACQTLGQFALFAVHCLLSAVCDVLPIVYCPFGKWQSSIQKPLIKRPPDRCIPSFPLPLPQLFS